MELFRYELVLPWYSLVDAVPHELPPAAKNFMWCSVVIKLVEMHADSKPYYLDVVC